ncbi:MAG: hypothetical protein HY540_07375 [Deltaproteobacteria bacterium]|nr:hypothetical protein [Deltaproteobacteria bacterium]
MQTSPPSPAALPFNTGEFLGTRWQASMFQQVLWNSPRLRDAIHHNPFLQRRLGCFWNQTTNQDGKWYAKSGITPNQYQAMGMWKVIHVKRELTHQEKVYFEERYSQLMSTFSQQPRSRHEIVKNLIQLAKSYGQHEELAALWTMWIESTTPFNAHNIPTPSKMVTSLELAYLVRNYGPEYGLPEEYYTAFSANNAAILRCLRNLSAGWKLYDPPTRLRFSDEAQRLAPYRSLFSAEETAILSPLVFT